MTEENAFATFNDLSQKILTQLPDKKFEDALFEVVLHRSRSKEIVVHAISQFNDMLAENTQLQGWQHSYTQTMSKIFGFTKCLSTSKTTIMFLYQRSQLIAFVEKD